MDLIRYLKVEFPRRYKRKELTADQLSFLQGLIPFSIIIQRQTVLKANTHNKFTSLGILASTILADCIIRSDWGKHLAVNKCSNPALLIKDPYRKNKIKTISNVQYRYFENYEEFASDYSDYLVFSGIYDSLLKCGISDTQIDELEIIHKKDGVTRNYSVEQVIEDYGLLEFDSL